MSITDSFIDGLKAQAESISIPVKQQARKCLLDYLGVVLGGVQCAQDRHSMLFEEFTENGGLFPIYGTSYTTIITNAVLLNGFCAHLLELDDGHRYGMIHLGGSIVTALLAVAEKESLLFDSVLRGIVMGYEVAVRCARSIQPGHKIRGYHVSGTCGTIGAAMGVAFARGYDRDQLKSTLACAVSSAAGVLEIQEEASEMKPYNIGRAALDGIIAAQMGRLALPGPDDVLGGRRGFLTVFTDTPHSEYLTDFTYNDYSIEGIYQKIHASCRHCHPAIDATLNIRNDINLKPEQVERIEVSTYKLAVGSHDHTQILGVSSAKLSTPYCVALAIVKGRAGYDDFNEENLANYWIKDLTKKVSVKEDEDLTRRSPMVRGAKVVIYLKDGGVFETTCVYPKGEPENPLTNDELEDKFKHLALFGGLSKKECDELLAEIRRDKCSIKKIIGLVCKR